MFQLSFVTTLVLYIAKYEGYAVSDQLLKICSMLMMFLFVRRHEEITVVDALLHLLMCLYAMLWKIYCALEVVR